MCAAALGLNPDEESYAFFLEEYAAGYVLTNGPFWGTANWTGLYHYTKGTAVDVAVFSLILSTSLEREILVVVFSVGKMDSSLGWEY